MKFHACLLLLFVIFFSACSSSDRETRHLFYRFYADRDYLKARDHILSNDYYKSDRQQLLQSMEIGKIFFDLQDYKSAARAFENAKSILYRQYTTRLSYKLESFVTNHASDIYYGHYYEHSMLFYYLTLTYFLQSEKLGLKDELLKAKATSGAWYDYQQHYLITHQKRPWFKFDVLHSLLTLLINEKIGTNDLKLQSIYLLTDAQNNFFKYYSILPIFNHKAQTFAAHFQSFNDDMIQEIKEKYFKPSDYFDKINQKITKVSRNLQTLKQIDQNLNDKSVSFFFDVGNIEKISSKTLKMELAGLSNDPAMMLYLSNVLGFLPERASPGEVYRGVIGTQLATKMLTFGHDVPHIPKNPKVKSFAIQFFKDGQLVLDDSITLMNPMNHILEYTLEVNNQQNLPIIYSRLLTKHLAAITTSYATYNLLAKNSKDKTFARLSATLQYAALSRAILESEKADERMWATLPANIYFYNTRLTAGSYQMKLLDVLDQQVVLEKSIQIGTEDYFDFVKVK